MTKNSKPSTIGRTIHYFWREMMRHKGLTIGMLVMAPLATLALDLVAPYLISQIIDQLTGGNFDLPTYTPYIIGYIILFILGEMVFYRFQVYFLWKLENLCTRDLQKQSFEALSAQSMHFHNNRFSGSLVSQTNKFSGAFERLVDVIMFDFMPLFWALVFSIIVLARLVPWFAVAMAVFVVIYTTIAIIAYRRMGPMNEELADAETKQSGQLADSISNILAVKSYGREQHERHRFANFYRRTFNANQSLMHATTIRDVFFGFCMVTISAALVIFLVYGNKWFGLSIGTLILMYSYCVTITNRVWGVNHILRNVNRSFGDAHDMTKILDTEQTVTDAPSASDLTIRHSSVTFDDISFTHADAKDAIFKNFTLNIPAGQRIGLVGRSGSGKTTITKLLLRFADVQSGSITIDGQNISEVTQVSLRENIAYVPQETTLFHRTIRDNIAYAKPDATDEEVIKAAKLANAWEFIETLPKGLDTLTGERGVKLSGGQRQRIAIARAILKDAPILVLDEATSALDSESEKLIQDALKHLMKGRTSLVIAHRLSTVASLDRIIVLSDGKILEDGSHAELVQKGGEYSHLWNRQTGAFIES